MFVGDAQLLQTINNLNLNLNTKNIVFVLFDRSTSSSLSLDRYLKSYAPHKVFLLVCGNSKDITLNDVQLFVINHKLKGFLEVDITSKKSVKNAILFAIRRPVPVRPLPVRFAEAHEATIKVSCCSIL
jgi:hypothetical protein